MKLKFWTRKEKARETIKELEVQVSKVDERMSKMDEQMRVTNELIQKQTRVQYRTSQQLLSEVVELNSKIDVLYNRQEFHALNMTKSKETQHKLQELGSRLIRWLDDIDHVRAGLATDAQDTWDILLDQWAEQLLAMLASIGIHELNLCGTVFDPNFAESCGTVAPHQLIGNEEEIEEEVEEADSNNSFAPYEIMEVIKRGYIYSDGHILRKAQVITLKEEETYERC